MWVPRSEREVLAAVEAGDLAESATFDAKAPLPSPGRSKNLAVDVAAMTVDGGTLLYGIAEDDHGRPRVPSPIELAGAAERVSQIVQSSISEPPTIEVREIPLEEDPARGYLAVVVPASPQAPHMVTVGGDNRYYGRNATGNARLTEGDVARLYGRRRRWETDREALLDEAVAKAPIERDEGYAYLHLFARPAVPDEDLLDRAKGERHVAEFLNPLFSAALGADVWPGIHGGKGYAPDLTGNNNSFARRADGWATVQGLGADWWNLRDPSDVLDFEIGLDGSGRLFCGRAAERLLDGELRLFENLLAGLATRFMSVLGDLYAAGAYLGPVDVGVAVIGLEGAVSSALADDAYTRHSRSPYDREEYRRTGRFPALTIAREPRHAARRLVSPLTRAITGERYDPFSD